MKNLYFTLTVASLFSSFSALANCPTYSPALSNPSCTASGCITPSQGQTLNINSGQLYCVPSSALLSIQGINMNGGELRVCGTLIANGAFNANSGTNSVSIASTGTLQVNQDINLSGTRIGNSGTLKTGGNITFNSCSSGSNLINGPGATLQMLTSGKSMIINGSPGDNHFYNEGAAYLKNVRVNGTSADRVCLNTDSPTYVTCISQGITSNQNNAFSAYGNSSSPVINASGLIDLQNISGFSYNSLLVYLYQGTSTLPSSLMPAPGPVTGGKWGSASASYYNTPLTCQTAGSLPIELLNFNATLNSEGSVTTQWSTATETNNDRFELERSNDGVEFSKIATIAAAGNSTQILSYSYTDASASAQTGTLYYRLRQVDYNGTYETFNIVAVEMKNGKESVQFANPQLSDNAFQMTLSGFSSKKATVSIYSLTGSLILKQSLALDAGGAHFTAAELLPAGTYLMVVQSEESTQSITRRIVLQ